MDRDIQSFNSLKGLRVLIAEDNYINQQLISRLLSLWGVQSEIAANGRVVLEKIASRNFDVVLMDILMPELDGYDTTIAIRKLEDDYFHELPIFAFSSTPNPEKILECKMTGHISKSPLDKVELYKTISKYLKQ